MANAVSDPAFSDPPGASCLVAFVSAAGSAAAPVLVAGSAADDRSAVDSAVSAPLRSVVEPRRGAYFAEAGSAAPGDLPAAAWQDDHSAVAVGLDDSVAAYSLPDGCSVVRPGDHRA